MDWGSRLELDAKIYVLSDDPRTRSVHLQTLSAAGYLATPIELTQQWMSLDDRDQPACAMLDWTGDQSPALPPLSAPCFQQGLPIIVLHSRADVQTAVAAMRQGAWDFLVKPVATELLLRRIVEALEHDRRCATSRRLCRIVRHRLASLTPRESQVMKLVVAGKANKQIASDLGVSIKTVEVHRANVMRKMEAGSLAELVQQAIRIGMDGEGI